MDIMRWLVLLIVFIGTIAYLFIGAAVFQALESENEQGTKTVSKERILSFLGKLVLPVNWSLVSL